MDGKKENFFPELNLIHRLPANHGQVNGQVANILVGGSVWIVVPYDQVGLLAWLQGAFLFLCEVCIRAAHGMGEHCFING